jgi:hypothetical protein
MADNPISVPVNCEDKALCGVIMPIAAAGDYSESHWKDVLSIISQAVSMANFGAKMVSEADETTLIHKTIVQNLYDNPIVICDVSGKNPNVMFELGLRLAFDKPTIIIKDDVTSFSFDTGTIEHLSYPRDLRFQKIVDFKEKLSAKIVATVEAAKSPMYSTFLKHFGKFTIAKLEEKEVSIPEFLAEELKSIRQSIDILRCQPLRQMRPVSKHRFSIGDSVSIINIDVKGISEESVKMFGIQLQHHLKDKAAILTRSLDDTDKFQIMVESELWPGILPLLRDLYFSCTGKRLEDSLILVTS